MHHFRTATPEHLHGQTVLLRCAPNAAEMAQTLRHFGPCNARWVLLTERGQPNGRYIPELSTEPLAEELQQLLQASGTDFSGVQFIPDTLGRMAQAAVRNKPAGSITMLENVGFLKEHSTETDAFGAQLAALTHGEKTCVVLDDFAACHQATGSVFGVQKHLPTFVGPSVARKVKAIDALKPGHGALAQAGASPRHHLVLAGANVAQNLELLEHLLPFTALVAAEGPTAHTLMAAKDMPIGRSPFDATQIPRARNSLVEAGILGCRVLLPVDYVNAANQAVPVQALPEDSRLGPVGPSTLNVWQKGLESAQSVLWRGLLSAPTGQRQATALQATPNTSSAPQASTPDAGKTATPLPNPNTTLARALQAHKLVPTLMRPKQVAFYEAHENLPYTNLSEEAVFTLLTGRLPLGLRGLAIEQAELAL